MRFNMKVSVEMEKEIWAVNYAPEIYSLKKDWSLKLFI